MGPLTESMTRLCGEIVALRGARLTFVRNLGQNVAAMKANFRQSHTEMARKTKAERQGFVEALGHEVASLRAGFRRSQREMAHKTRAERRKAVTHLKKTISALRRDFAQDLAGAHRAFFGPSPGELRARAEAGRRAKEEAERQRLAEARAREEAERQRLAAEARAREEAAKPEAKEEAGRHGKKKG